jgi:CHAD domain-containing protein
MHDLRIRLKKFRYTLEFFETVDDGKAKRRLIKTVSGLQEILGEMNDILVARQQLRAMISQSRAGEDTHSLALAGGMLLGWHGRRYVVKRRRARRRIKELARCDAFRKPA